MKPILCVPLDPVHDVGIKIINAELRKRGFETNLLSPDLPFEEIAALAAAGDYSFILVSRTLGYGVAELLSRFIDILDASGVREKSKIVLGGKPVTPELAAELGYDKGFGEHTSLDELVAYLEGRVYTATVSGAVATKPSVVSGYTYTYRDGNAGKLLDIIVDKLLAWGEGKTSHGIERSRLREVLLAEQDARQQQKALDAYSKLCSPGLRGYYLRNEPLAGVRGITFGEQNSIRQFAASVPVRRRHIRHQHHSTLFFKFLGSGCPLMDIAHAKVCEQWGVDGFLLINPSWEARDEGLASGLLSHQNDGTITSFENVRLTRELLSPGTLLTVRAHRGLNTPETVLLAGMAGADMVKINLVYGSLGAGTDPYRLAVDGIAALQLAARFGLPFDIPGNDELSGVPAHKSLAGLLINCALGIRLGARPIPKPLFCYGPDIVINRHMEDNFIDYNAAKISVLRRILDAPVWPGEPIAFMTQEEERVQSATATSYHAVLAAGLRADAVTIASTDEAYSRGPIAIASRIDSIRSVAEGMRFAGNGTFTISARQEAFAESMYQGILQVLSQCADSDSLPDAISSGILGDRHDGAYPGTFGRGTVQVIA